MRERTADLARGKWFAILQALGLEKRFLSRRSGPCPMCEGRTRFKFDDHDGAGTWFCSHCGAGDGVKLVMALRGCSTREALRLVDGVVGRCERQTVRPAQTDAQRIAEARSIWASGSPLTADCVVTRYLRHRTGASRLTGSLRVLMADPWPVMIGAIRDAKGEIVGTTRTWLDTNGRGKAPIAEPRKHNGTKPPGCAVRLQAAGETLVVGEGIETSLAAGLLFGAPAWALLDALTMAKFVLPAGVRRLIIAGDADASFTGQAAAYELARRMMAMKPEVRPAVEVQIPDRLGVDWADVYATRQNLAA